ncbi:unnamed protein product [Dicrocoelium dendriticum]|nr:unnamed protein product [Dicrocoelium dendriticum]
MVCRVKPLKGVPHYQRAVLERHGLGEDTKNHSWILVKNTPSVNQDLYVIKHLVRIQPVKFPQGLPTADDDLTKCRLLPDGRFFRYPKDSVSGEFVTENTATVLPSSSVSIPTEDVSKIFQHSTDDKGYLTRAYLRKYHNRQWDRFQLFDEFFTSHYRYKLNQDGSEYRYSRLWRLDNAMFHAIRKQRNPDGTLKAPNQTRFEANWSTYPWSKF